MEKLTIQTSLLFFSHVLKRKWEGARCSGSPTGGIPGCGGSWGWRFGSGVGAGSESSALGFCRSSFSPPGGDKGRPPSAPPSFYSRALQPSASSSCWPARIEPTAPCLVRGPWRGSRGSGEAPGRVVGGGVGGVSWGWGERLEPAVELGLLTSGATSHQFHDSGLSRQWNTVPMESVMGNSGFAVRLKPVWEPLIPRSQPIAFHRAAIFSMLWPISSLLWFS